MHKTQKKLLEAIRKKPESTINELRAACKIEHTSSADYHLKQLMLAGLIRKVNRWEIIVKE